jgi:hypothetical protein
MTESFADARAKAEKTKSDNKRLKGFLREAKGRLTSLPTPVSDP